MMNETASPTPQLSWMRQDPEQRIAFRGGRFTRVNTWCALLLGTVLATVFYAGLVPFEGHFIFETFNQRGIIPYCIVFFSGWSIAILILKSLKLRLQHQALSIVVVPEDPEFVLSPSTVDDIRQGIYRAVDDPKHFVLFNRITVALSNLRNLGRVSDVDEILHTQADHDESAMETSYSLIQGFVWAIPVLGFIGTVQGLSMAIGSFGGVLSASSDLGNLKDALKQVTAGLSVAFETTMHGLVAALFIQLALTALKKSEEEFLDACSEYCARHIVGRLRLLAYDQPEDA